MSGPDVKKIDPLIIAVAAITRDSAISKQQLVDALMLVINGKITQSWEQSNGMTREKTELIQAKKALSELSFNGEETVDNSIYDATQDIIMKLSVFKRMKAEGEARQKAEEARQKAEEAREKAEEERKAAEDAQGDGNDNEGAVDLPEDPTEEDEYNDYSSSN
tara:strand:+ start:266 stop:754 length:489 start_codon:yes stop_codon:yes gene_type:complete